MGDRVTVVLSDAPVSYTELLDVGVLADWSEHDELVAVHFAAPGAVISGEH